MENENPNIYQKLGCRAVTDADEDENVVDPFDDREIFGKHFSFYMFMQMRTVKL